MPSRERIARTWRTLCSALGHFANWDGTGECCMACGWAADGFKPQRAHIEPRFEHSDDTPTNLVLLCDRCHREAPENSGRAAMVAWMRSRPFWWDIQEQRTGATIRAFLAAHPGLSDAVPSRTLADAVLTALGQQWRHLSPPPEAVMRAAMETAASRVA